VRVAWHRFGHGDATPTTLPIHATGD